METPVITLVEAKNDNLKAGLAQCMAEIVVARIFNEQAGYPRDSIYGIVTNGEQWQFLELKQTKIVIDLQDYYVDNLEKIMGIILSLIRSLLNPHTF